MLENFDQAIDYQNWPKPNKPTKDLKIANTPDAVDAESPVRVKYYFLIGELSTALPPIPQDLLFQAHIQGYDSPASTITILERWVTKIFKETIAEMHSLFPGERLDHVTELSLHGLRVASQLMKQLITLYPELTDESIEQSRKAASKISKRLMRLNNDTALSIESVLGIFTSKDAFTLSTGKLDVSQAVAREIDQVDLTLGTQNCPDFSFDVTNAYTQLIVRGLQFKIVN